jgi:hypothetical protein
MKTDLGKYSHKSLSFSKNTKILRNGSLFKAQFSTSIKFIFSQLTEHINEPKNI